MYQSDVLNMLKLHFSVESFLRPRTVIQHTTTVFKDLEPEESYKYLEVTEEDGIQNFSKREKNCKECFRRVKSIQRSELNARNRIDAINSLAPLW